MNKEESGKKGTNKDILEAIQVLQDSKIEFTQHLKLHHYIEEHFLGNYVICRFNNTSLRTGLLLAYDVNKDIAILEKSIKLETISIVTNFANYSDIKDLTKIIDEIAIDGPKGKNFSIVPYVIIKDIQEIVPCRFPHGIPNEMGESK